MTIAPGTRVKSYYILTPLGRGGMAEVYKARHVDLDVDVAIKFMRIARFGQDILPSVIKRFQIEAQRMAQLSHPNIVKVSDFGNYKGIPYLVMEYLPDGTLKEHMGAPVPWQDAAKLLLPIAEALAYAHSEGVIHRDVKPANILLAKGGQPMLSDFGVAKIMDSEHTQGLTATGASIGTPEYMAPEQAAGKKIDHRVDVYSLGVIFYELVTGRRPFTADTPMDVIIKQATEPLTPPSRFVKGLPKAVEEVLFTALAKNPGDRFADMGAMADALRGLASGAMVKKGTPARKKPAALKVKKYKTAKPAIKKNKSGKGWLIGAAGIAMVGLVIFAGVKLFGGGDETAESETTGEQAAAIAVDETPTPEATSTPEFTLTPQWDIDSTIISDKDSMTMVYVPKGPFAMGKNHFNDASPVHTVNLDAFWMDKTEVTNTMFAQFLNEIGNPKESNSTWLDNSDEDVRISQINGNWQADSGYADHPVVMVSWYGAQAYCEWAGRDLPTEAQWEKAARGEDALTYPWGNTFDSSVVNLDDETIIDDYTINCTANGCDGYDRTAPVGSFPHGASPYGALDMSGNVAEWVRDWYDYNYYYSSPYENPENVVESSDKVLRGGGWGYSPIKIRSYNRGRFPPKLSTSLFGFRCAMNAE